MKLIKNWKELSEIPPNNKYRIIIKDCCGWIVPICDIPNNHDYICCCNDDNEENYYDNHVYLSTHTFYGSQYEYSTKVLQEHGFDVEIDNWDKEEK